MKNYQEKMISECIDHFGSGKEHLALAMPVGSETEHMADRIFSTLQYGPVIWIMNTKKDARELQCKLGKEKYYFVSQHSVATKKGMQEYLKQVPKAEAIVLCVPATLKVRRFIALTGCKKTLQLLNVLDLTGNFRSNLYPCDEIVKYPLYKAWENEEVPLRRPNIPRMVAINVSDKTGIQQIRYFNEEGTLCFGKASECRFIKNLVQEDGDYYVLNRYDDEHALSEIFEKSGITMLQLKRILSSCKQEISVDAFLRKIAGGEKKTVKSVNDILLAFDIPYILKTEDKTPYGVKCITYLSNNTRVEDIKQNLKQMNQMTRTHLKRDRYFHESGLTLNEMKIKRMVYHGKKSILVLEYQKLDCLEIA